MIYYLDSSAWLKRYFLEPGSDIVQRLFSEDPTTLISSRLGLLEVLAAMARRASRESISDAAIEHQLEIARRDFTQMVQITITESLWASAERLGIQHRMRAADALHLAAALDAKSRLGEVAVVSSDLELIVAVLAEGLAALNPLNPTP